LDTLTVADYLGILRHRKYFFLVPAVIALVVGVVVVMNLPPVYRSYATVLIESQQIPDQFVRSTITSLASERVEVIRQRVLTSENLIPIIKKFNLYGDRRERLAPSQLADILRENFEIELVSADTGQRGRNQALTIAFNIYFKDPSATAAQQVVNELVTLFLAQDADIRTTKTRETQKFLDAQAQKIGEAIAAQEQRIADFKTEYRSKLPESASANQSLLDRLSAAHRDAVGRIQALRNNIQLLETQLASTIANSGSTNPGINSPAQLAQELARLLSIYTEKHPEVIALRERIEAQKNNPLPAADFSSDPVVMQVTSQISAARSELQFLTAEQAKLEAQLADVEASINAAPDVERQYNELLRDMTNLSAEYQQIKSKALEAEVAVQMEAEQKGERFKLIEAAVLPVLPFSPDRPKLLVIVVFLALGSGAGTLLLAEMAQPLQRGARGIAALLGGEPPLVTIPFIENPEDRRRSHGRTRMMLLASAALFVIVILLVHFFVIELDLLWLQVLQRVGSL
jgi:polysaccharide chain length determinant protein (PEP-CTERM system associated)